MKIMDKQRMHLFMQTYIDLKFGLRAFLGALTISVLGGAPITSAQAQTSSTKLGSPAVAVKTTAGVPLPSGVAIASNGKLVASDFARILDRGELVVAAAATDTPPFFYQKDGEQAGTDIDMARQIAKEIGVPVRIDRSAKSFNGVVELVARGQADLGISKLSSTLARSQTVRFSNPYLVMKHALIINRVEFAKIARDQPLPQVIRSFTGSIGVLANSSWVDAAARNFPKAKIVPVSSWPEAIKSVQRGELVAAYRDEFEIRRILRADPSASLILRTVTLKDLDDPLAIAVGVNDANLLAFVNLYLSQRRDALTVDLVLDALNNK